MWKKQKTIDGQDRLYEERRKLKKKSRHTHETALYFPLYLFQNPCGVHNHSHDILDAYLGSLDIKLKKTKNILELFIDIIHRITIFFKLFSTIFS